MGVTHVHLFVFDFLTVDENHFNSNEYNWGYDPLNYNVPEGSYSTDPHLGDVRIKEFKQMVKALHDATSELLWM
jgi:pullulanase